jgi:hypothetical protein
MSNKDDSEIDLIKDYLKSRGYKSTLECLEKEDSYKSVDKKNMKVRNKFIFFIIIYRNYQMINKTNFQKLFKNQKKKQNN